MACGKVKLGSGWINLGSGAKKTRAGNFDTTCEPDTKLVGLGHKRVDPFMTRLSYLNGSCRGSPAGDPPDPFIFFFF
jgi:hypothetical protein